MCFLILLPIKLFNFCIHIFISKTYSGFLNVPSHSVLFLCFEYNILSYFEIKIVQNIFLWPALPVCFSYFCLFVSVFSLSFSCWNIWSFKRKTSKAESGKATGSGLCCSAAWGELIFFTGRCFLLDCQFFQEVILLSSENKKSSTLWKRREKTGVSLFCMQTFTWKPSYFHIIYYLSVHSAQLFPNPDLSSTLSDKNCVLSSLSKRVDSFSLLFALSIIFNLFMYFLIYFSSSSSKTPTHPVSEILPFGSASKQPAFCWFSPKA